MNQANSSFLTACHIRSQLRRNGSAITEMCGVGFIFAVTFLLFMSTPVISEATHNFTVHFVGIALSAAIVGALLSTAMSSMIDISVPHWCTRNPDGRVPEENRMVPAMVGSLLVTISIFWICLDLKTHRFTVYYRR